VPRPLPLKVISFNLLGRIVGFQITLFECHVIIYTEVIVDTTKYANFDSTMA